MSPYSEHDSTLEKFLPSAKTPYFEIHDRDDYLDQKLQEMNKQIEELYNSTPVQNDGFCTDPPFTIQIMQKLVSLNFKLL